MSKILYASDASAEELKEAIINNMCKCIVDALSIATTKMDVQTRIAVNVYLDKIGAKLSRELVAKAGKDLFIEAIQRVAQDSVNSVEVRAVSIKDMNENEKKDLMGTLTKMNEDFNQRLNNKSDDEEQRKSGSPFDNII